MICIYNKKIKNKERKDKYLVTITREYAITYFLMETEYSYFHDPIVVFSRS